MKKLILILVIFYSCNQTEEIKPDYGLKGTYTEIEPTSNGVKLIISDSVIYNNVWFGQIESLKNQRYE